MQFIDLSHPLIQGQKPFPGDPEMSVEIHCTTAMAQRCNVTKLTMGTNMGTHLDAMFHFVETGKTLDAMPLDWFCGPAHLLRIPKTPREEITVADFAPFEEFLTPGARIIYETGWHRHYGQADYYTDFPSLTQDAARFLAEKKIRLLGMDTPTPSRDAYEVHHNLLGAEVVIVESRANLNNAPDAFTFIGFPLNIQGRDGSPIRAVAMVG